MRIEKLTKEDRETPLWKKIEGHCLAVIQELREMNDFPMPEIVTNSIRGKIEAYKDILDLNQNPNQEE